MVFNNTLKSKEAIKISSSLFSCLFIYLFLVFENISTISLEMFHDRFIACRWNYSCVKLFSCLLFLFFF